MTIKQYMEKSKLQQAVILRENAVYLDQYTDDGKTVFVYYLNGFFIEAVTKVGVIIDVIPYQRYSVSQGKLQEILAKTGGTKHAA
jgi:hypothetical protein